MKRKGLTAFLTAVLLAAFITGCSGKAEEPAAETKAGESSVEETDEKEAATENEAENETDADKTFTVGFDQDFPPMGFVGDDGEYTGFDLALAKETASRLGYEVVYQPIAWDSKDMELKTGAIDCIWNGFTIDGREDKYEWTTPYMANKQVFVVNKDSGIKTLKDLAGKVVAVQTESSAEAALKQAADLTATFEETKAIADYNTGLMELEAGAVDAVAMDETVAGYQLTKRGEAGFMILEETLSEEEYAVGFLLGNTELRDKVQTALEEMAADGTLAKISEEWFGKDITTIGK